MWVFSDTFFNYLRDRPLVKMLLDTFLIMLMVTWFAGMYIIAANYSDIKTSLFAPKQPSISTTALMNKSIDTELINDMQQTQADRIAVFRFHNGIIDDTKATNTFLYASETNEIARQGVSYEAGKRQNILLSLFTSWVGTLAKAQCILISHNQDDNIYSGYLKETGVKSALKCPVFSVDHILIGSISVEYTGEYISLDKLKEYEPKVISSATRIGGILSIK